MAISVSSPSRVSGKGLADEEEMSSGDDDPVFEEDMEALRRACMLPGTNPLQPEKEEGTDMASMESSEEKDDDTDLEWARNIIKRFPDQNEEPLSLKPLKTLPPIAEEGEDDDEFKILSDIEKRFASRSRDTSSQAHRIQFNANLPMVSKPSCCLFNGSFPMEATPACCSYNHAPYINHRVERGQLDMEMLENNQLRFSKHLLRHLLCH